MEGGRVGLVRFAEMYMNLFALRLVFGEKCVMLFVVVMGWGNSVDERGMVNRESGGFAEN